MSRTLIVLLSVVLLVACQSSEQEVEDMHAVYYWRTELRLDSTERTFLAQHHINKVYCRYFDVVMGAPSGKPEPTPNATMTFADSLPPDVELIPTVYITEDCMHEPHPDLAEKVVKRIVQMNETNGIHGVREIQIDCDYTARSRQNYYQFLKDVHSSLVTHHSSLDTHHSSLDTHHSSLVTHHSSLLSTTIRLHQLAMPAPPVDYGVLMLYNTGDPRQFDEKNPVLDYRDVHPYLKRLGDYPLPLAAAYPVYQWVRNINGVRVEHTVEAAEILRVKKAVEQERPALRKAIITYHLDKDNILRYKPETYEAIYHH